MDILLGSGIGVAIGIVIAPLVLWGISKYRETKVRNKVKEMIDNKEIIIPLDEKDYDTEMWKDFIPKDSKDTLKNLDKNMFKRDDIIITEEKNEETNKS